MNGFGGGAPARSYCATMHLFRGPSLRDGSMAADRAEDTPALAGLLLEGSAFPAGAKLAHSKSAPALVLSQDFCHLQVIARPLHISEFQQCPCEIISRGVAARRQLYQGFKCQRRLLNIAPEKTDQPPDLTRGQILRVRLAATSSSRSASSRSPALRYATVKRGVRLKVRWNQFRGSLCVLERPNPVPFPVRLQSPLVQLARFLRDARFRRQLRQLDHRVSMLGSGQFHADGWLRAHGGVRRRGTHGCCEDQEQDA
jgi:hypothetical protein